MCASDDDRPEQKEMDYTVTQCENIRSQLVLEPEYGNALAAYISPLNEFFWKFCWTYSAEEMTSQI